MSEVACPHCGAPLDAPEVAAVVVCAYCQSYSVVHDGSLRLAGQQAKLMALRSVVKRGQRARARGRELIVLGRVRYDYEDGLWDEWSVRLADGALAWLQDDEGELTLFESRLVGAPTDLSARVGQSVSVLGRELFVSERGEAEIVGGEGVITSAMQVGERFRYLDGNGEGEQLVAMSSQRGTVLYAGHAVDDDEYEVLR